MHILIKAIGKTINEFKSKSEFMDFIRQQIFSDTLPRCYLLPEYAWGDITTDDLDSEIREIQSLLDDQSLFVFGTAVRSVSGNRYNSAMVVSNNRIEYIDKTNVLLGERKRHRVQTGSNNRIFLLGKLKIAVIICADMWNQQLLDSLVHDEQADMVLVPAFTVVPAGLGNYAKIQWYSLLIVRSREYIVPFAVADHPSRDNGDYTTGSATAIVDPSIKHNQLTKQEDFLQLPQNGVVLAELNLEHVDEYRQYRTEKGIFQKKSSSDI